MQVYRHYNNMLYNYVYVRLNIILITGKLISLSFCIHSLITDIHIFIIYITDCYVRT